MNADERINKAIYKMGRACRVIANNTHDGAKVMLREIASELDGLGSDVEVELAPEQSAFEKWMRDYPHIDRSSRRWTEYEMIWQAGQAHGETIGRVKLMDEVLAEVAVASTIPQALARLHELNQEPDDGKR